MHRLVEPDAATARPVDASMPLASMDLPKEAQCGGLPIETVDAAITSDKCEPQAPADEPGDGPPPDVSTVPMGPSQKHYLEVKEDLTGRIEPAPVEIPSDAWIKSPDYLGDGVRTRLTSLATIHLTEAGAARCPDQVRQLSANSNRVLLGAAPNCDLYQERVIRTLAQQAGARLLVADGPALHLDDLPPPSNPSPEEGGVGDGDNGDMGGGGSGYETSDEDGELPPLVDDIMGPSRRTKQTARKRAPPSSQRPLSFVIRERAPPENAEEAAKQRPSNAGAAAEKEAVATDDGKKEEDKKKVEEDVKMAEADAKDAAPGAPAAGAEARADEGEAKPMGEGEKQQADNADESDEEAIKEKDIRKKHKEVTEQLRRVAAALPISSSRNAIVTERQKMALREAQKAGAETHKSLNEMFEAVRRMEALTSGLGYVRGNGGGGGSGGPYEAFMGGGGGPSSDPHSARGVAAATLWKKGDRVTYLGAGGAYLSEERERANVPPSFKMGPNEMREAGLSRFSLPVMIARREAALSRRKGGAGGGTGPSAAAEKGGNGDDSASGAPPTGSFGHVHNVSGDKVEVVMDFAFSGGKNFSGQQDKCGFVCSPADLGPIDEREDALASSFQALFDVIKEESGTTPLVVFLPGMDRMLRSHNTEQFRRLKELLGALPARCLFIGGYCSRALAKEKASSAQSGLSMLFGGGGRGGGDSLSVGPSDDFPPWYERLGRGMSRSRSSVKGRAFATMLPNHIELHPPHADSAAKAWKKMLDADVACMRERANRAALKKAMAKCEVVCPNLEAVKVTELALSKKEVEQVVGAAVASALMEPPVVLAEAAADTAAAAAVVAATTTTKPAAAEVCPIEEKMDDAMDAEEPAVASAIDIESHLDKPLASAAPAVSIQMLTVSAEHLTAAAASIQHLRAEAAPVPERSALKDLSTDQYERQLLSEVIPPEEIPIGFEDIGALDAVKTTLHEVVILPLQRPELFTRGALTRPTKGLLLFGPPGTGKTMLAKAVASESGAHFININMSAITSKWLGEGERLVRAVFSLAHKLAPSVIFIDEIDSFLAKRGGHSHEHEALRKMKTEFLAGWDGIRTKSTDRVLVLAATNRPMDLDEAAIRRMPRRIFVPLPDASNREKILSVILKDEEVDKNLDFAELGRETDGYSGSDLKNLCIAAAYCPLRELLQAEKERKGEGELPPVRPISMGDFKSAMKQVTPSTHVDSASMSELQRWNEQFGEGGSRRAEPLVYYT